MFDIEYKGANTIVISGKNSTIITDPGSSEYTGAIPKNSVELLTEERFAKDNDKYMLKVSCPGSYEVSDFSINGFEEKRHIDNDDRKDSVVYSIEISGIRIGLFGNVSPEDIEKQLENIGIIDIIVIPVGGSGYTLDATAASTIAKASDAKIIIPIHYNDGTNYEVPQNDLDVFIKEIGIDNIEKTPKFKVKSISNIPEKITIVQIEKTK